MDVFATVTLLFPIKGHTHGPLDGIGGHCVTRCSHMTFDSADELTNVYQDFLSRASFEEGTFAKSCWKHDESPDWNAWIAEIPLNFANLTGPLAPHGFRILRRKYIKQADLDHAKYHCANQSPDDIMLAVYEYMSDPLPYQVVRLFSPSALIICMFSLSVFRVLIND